MNKLVVNHLGKTIVTSDGATIVRELEVMHPAAKMVVMASQMQEQETGDGTSLVVTLTGEQCAGQRFPTHAGLSLSYCWAPPQGMGLCALGLYGFIWQMAEGRERR